MYWKTPKSIKATKLIRENYLFEGVKGENIAWQSRRASAWWAKENVFKYDTEEKLRTPERETKRKNIGQRRLRAKKYDPKQKSTSVGGKVHLRGKKVRQRGEKVRQRGGKEVLRGKK